ncbi:hypothetical protein [Streptomyces sp. NPDC002825]|uniref:hypothetical protein n=1 Tax=Streptomyces sp. NPDC002825 TaxID=3154666 RepID=UPI00332DB1E9
MGEADSFASIPGGPVLRALASRSPVLLTGGEPASATADSENKRAAEMARDHVRSWLAVPMPVGELPLGVVVLTPSAIRRSFDLGLHQYASSRSPPASRVRIDGILLRACVGGAVGDRTASRRSLISWAPPGFLFMSTSSDLLSGRLLVSTVNLQIPGNP